MRRTIAPLPLLFFVMSAHLACGDEPFLRFEEQTIDPNIGKVCYAVTQADVDGDGRPDIVAVSENRVLWYQNPTWQPRVMIEDATPRDNVCIAPHDVDGDGQIDFALGAGWTKIGTIHWLRRGDSLDEPWQVYTVGEEPWLHRMRWADVLGEGPPQLVISPLNATRGDGVRLMAFEVPDDPAKDRWPATLLDGELNAMHNHWHFDFNDDGTVDTLTASREGVHVVRRTAEGWKKRKLGTGARGDEPTSNGAGEIKTGRLPGGGTFVVTVEPMHGDQLVVYTAPSSAADEPLWRRQVIDEGFRRGHALWAADFDGDGGDEIVLGHSDTPEVHGVQIYRATDANGMHWQRQIIDAGEMATEDIVVADFSGNGRFDIVAGGRATRNVKLYKNLPPGD